MRRLPLFLALVLSPFSSLGAQEPGLLEAGARVRVSAAPPASKPEWIVGTVITATAERLTILAETDSTRQVEISRRAVTRLQVSDGYRSRGLTGFTLGFLVGAAAGAAISYAAWHDGHDFAPRDAMLLGAVPGGLVGGLTGLGIGSSSTSERWHDVPLTVGTMDHSRQPVRFSVGLRLQTR